MSCFCFSELLTALTRSKMLKFHPNTRWAIADTAGVKEIKSAIVCKSNFGSKDWKFHQINDGGVAETMLRRSATLPSVNKKVPSASIGGARQYIELAVPFCGLVVLFESYSSLWSHHTLINGNVFVWLVKWLTSSDQFCVHWFYFEQAVIAWSALLTFVFLMGHWGAESKK